MVAYMPTLLSTRMKKEDDSNVTTGVTYVWQDNDNNNNNNNNYKRLFGIMKNTPA
jgi:hypothetical protein